MHPQLADLVRQLESATTGVRALAASTTDLAFARRPEPARWSPAECVVHLNLSAEAFLPRFDAIIAAHATAPHDFSGRYQRDVMGWLLALILEPPYRNRTATPAAFVPGAAAPRDAVVADFARLNLALAERAAAMSGLDLNAIRVTSPFRANTSYNAWSALCVIAVHERRHLWQAQQALGT